MLRCINTKAGYANVDQITQIPGNTRLYLRIFGFEIGETNQFTLLNIVPVPVVSNTAIHVKIFGGKIRELLSFKCGSGETATTACSHMIDHCINVDIHTNRITPLYHIDEFSTIATATY